MSIGVDWKAMYEADELAIAELETTVTRLEAVAQTLAKYGGHLGGCADPFTGGQLRCDCGWDAALTTYKDVMGGERWLASMKTMPRN